jgi:hypothetical protein
MSNPPKHYQICGLECIDIIDDVLKKWEAKQPVNSSFGFRMGNVIKYILRAPEKNSWEDLKKARNYINLILAEQDEIGKDTFEEEVTQVPYYESARITPKYFKPFPDPDASVYVYLAGQKDKRGPFLAGDLKWVGNDRSLQGEIVDWEYA